MQRLNMAWITVVVMGLYGAAALAADSDINLQVLNEKVKAKVSIANPTVVAVKASGPINANLRLVGSHSGSCVALVLELAPGVCVPSGPGGPVSPN